MTYKLFENYANAIAAYTWETKYACEGYIVLPEYITAEDILTYFRDHAE